MLVVVVTPKRAYWRNCGSRGAGPIDQGDARDRRHLRAGTGQVRERKYHEQQTPHGSLHRSNVSVAASMLVGEDRRIKTHPLCVRGVVTPLAGAFMASAAPLAVLHRDM